MLQSSIAVVKSGMKTVLLVSEKPEHALYPYPVNCTGWRVWQLMRLRIPELSRREYLSGFERVNLVNSRQAAAKLPSLYAGRTILILGEDVRDALELPDILIHPFIRDDCIWRQLPHPSIDWYNDPDCRLLAATLLEELYLEGKK